MKNKKHTPERKAYISTDEDYGNRIYFEYANGTPGDLIIEINRLEVTTWRKIVNAVNSHDELLGLVIHLKEFLGGYAERPSEAIVKKAIAKAEGK